MNTFFGTVTAIGIWAISTAAMASGPATIIECTPVTGDEPVVKLLEIQDGRMVQVSPYDVMGNMRPFRSSMRADPNTGNQIYTYRVRHTFGWGKPGELIGPAISYNRVEVRGTLVYDPSNPDHSVSSETIYDTSCDKSFLTAFCLERETKDIVVHKNVPATCTIRSL